MLASRHRLRSATDIARVYKRGSYGGSGGALSVKAILSGRPHYRLVVVVGKKVSKKAVVRNTIRRKLVELVRTNQATVPGGYDIVVSVHADISRLTAQALTAHLAKALVRAGVVKSS